MYDTINIFITRKNVRTIMEGYMALAATSRYEIKNGNKTLEIERKYYESFEMVLRIHHLLLVAGYDPFAMFEDLTNYYGIDVGEFFKVDSLECRPTKMVKRHTIPLMVRSDLYHEAMVTGEVCNERKRQSYAI